MPDTPLRASTFLLGFFLGVFLFLPLAAPPAFSKPDPHAPSAEIARLEARLAEAVNQVRSERRLVALERVPALDAVARAHSRDMARRRYLSHTSPEGADWVARLQAAHVEGFSLAGENVGLTSRTQPNREILSGWLASPVHRENLLARPYNATGIGIARGADGTLYYTQLYLTFPR